MRPAAGMIRRGLVPGDIYYVPNDDAAEAFADASSWPGMRAGTTAI